MKISKKQEYVIKLTMDDLEKLYKPLPQNKKETEFEWIHRMGNNKLVIDLIGKLVDKI